MTSVGDSFAWPFQDPGWFGKMVLQGLISIIPIVGWIALVGWFMMTIDNYRAGRRELPPAGFHPERGVGLFVVLLVYGIVFSLDRKSTRLNSSHGYISYAVFCLKKKKRYLWIRSGFTCWL